MFLRHKVSRLRTASVFLCESAQRTGDTGRQEDKWGRENRKTEENPLNETRRRQSQMEGWNGRSASHTKDQDQDSLESKAASAGLLIYLF